MNQSAHFKISAAGNDYEDDQISREFMSDDEEYNDSDDEYRNFLTGLFSDELEEEDDEEYNPDFQEEDDDDDEEDDDEENENENNDMEEDADESDDDDDDDGSHALRGLKKVAKREVQDLVDGCWKTLLGVEVVSSDPELSKYSLHKKLISLKN